MPRQVFTAGEILTAANMNDLSDQTVMVFDDSAARGSAIPTPSEGMVTYLKDTDALEKYDGSAFIAAAPAQTGVLQVVSTTKTDVYTETVARGTFTDEVPGLQVTITPTSATSKLLVFVDVSVSVENPLQAITHRLLRNGSAVILADAAGSRIRATSSGEISGSQLSASMPYHFLDSPNTTSPVTYGVTYSHMSGVNRTVFINRGEDNTDSNAFARSTSTITVMEVAS